MNENKNFKTFTGVIIVNLGKGFYQVELENKHKIIARVGGKMKGRTRRLMVADKIHVEMSPYDMARGRIIKLLT